MASFKKGAYCLQNDKLIEFEPNERVIVDPIEYEMEFKKRTTWSRKELESFLTAILQHPK